VVTQLIGNMDNYTHSMSRRNISYLSLTGASALAERLYGIRATAFDLPSERDQNLLLRSESGERFILKLANIAERREVLEAECAVMVHLEPTELTPRVIRTVEGAVIGMHGSQFVRLISALPGTTLGTAPLHTDALRRDLGRAVGRVDRALADFDHPAFHRDFHWDLANAVRVVGTYLPLVTDTAIADRIAKFTAYHRAHVVPILSNLRRGVIYNDANDYNVLIDEAGQVVTGIFDFGDMVHSHIVNDVAITMAYVTFSAADPLAAAAAVVAGYHETHPLTELELEALFSLMCMRLCVSACIAAKQIAERPADDYLRISQGPLARKLPLLAAIHPRYAHYTFRDACGLPPVPQAPRVTTWLAEQAVQFAPLIGRDLRTTPVAPIDLSAGSPLVSSEPCENTPAELDRRIQRRLAEHGATVGAGGYDEARLIYEWPNEPAASEPRTIHIGLDLSLPAGSPLHAPLDGVVHAFENATAHHDYGPVIVLRHRTDDPDSVEFYSLYGHLSSDSHEGLRVGQPIEKGAVFARVGSAPSNGDWWPHVHVQLVTDLLDVPCNVDGVVRASQRRVWKSLCPDPNLILGIPMAELPHHVPKSAIAAARHVHIGGNLSVSYGANPLNIIRGYKQYLYDDVAHRYIDGFNNVAHVGHCHPRVVRAVSEQLAVLNTNTRYLQEQLTQYAEQLTALLPASLSVCYFTASGSEANELALRLARAHTGARDLIVMDSAYHGHTTTLIDISPYKHAGPSGEGAPEWVHRSPIPDVYRLRGAHADPGTWFASQVGDVIADLTAKGRRPSGYIAETCPSVGGQIMLPKGFLADVYARVHAAGGICIADEVQTGFGRLGTHFWAFEAHDVTPDILVLGKPIANGYPMGAVVTTRAIAESFDNGMEFFSTFGGSTAACVAALTTLQVTLDEDLQRNALVVGERLLSGLRPLMGEFEIVGDVRGAGLFLGVELVRDRHTLEPAPDEATFVVDRMRQRGVLVGTDGPYHNVIKIRGPMTLSLSDADQVVDTLSRALRELPSRR
jgi:4-aminobutyrate aminotransferase-like enzyme/Ser/Thr protein kinase RdoA (MazF antagonist)